jgi:hypothetical protein
VYKELKASKDLEPVDKNYELEEVLNVAIVAEGALHI